MFSKANIFTVKIAGKYSMLVQTRYELVLSRGAYSFLNPLMSAIFLGLPDNSNCNCVCVLIADVHCCLLSVYTDVDVSCFI